MRYVTVLQDVLRFAREHDVHLVHAHTEDFAELACGISRDLGVPSVATIHGVNTARNTTVRAPQRRYLGRWLNAADRVILVGEPLRKFVKGLTGRDGHFRVVHNGVRLFNVERQHEPFASSTVRLISVSNLHEGKGVDITLRALEQLSRRGIKNWHYTVVGGGAMGHEWRGLASDLGIGDLVEFVGPVEHSRVAGFLSRADIFVLPSYREAFGIAYLEAMSLGLLVIGVEMQGAAEFVKHGINGLLVRPKSVEHLSEQLSFALGNPDETRRMARNGLVTATVEFTWTAHAESLLGVYEELVSRQSATP